MRHTMEYYKVHTDLSVDGTSEHIVVHQLVCVQYLPDCG